MTIYPTGIDSFTTKIDNSNDVMAIDVNGLQSGIVALQRTLGINPLDGYASLAARISGVEKDLYRFPAITSLPGVAIPVQNQSNIRHMIGSGNAIYVAGQFTALGGVTRSGLMAMDTNTNTILPVAISIAPAQTILGIHPGPDGSGFYIYGDFTNINGVTRNRLAWLNWDGSVRTEFNANASSQVRQVFLSGTSLYVAGAFTTIGGGSKSTFAKLDSITGNLDASFTVSSITPSSVLGIVALASGLGIVGTFTSVNSVTKRGFAVVNYGTGANLFGAINPFLNQSTVFTPGNWFTRNDDIIIAGTWASMTNVGTNLIARDGLVKLNPYSGVADTTFNSFRSWTASTLPADLSNSIYKNYAFIPNSEFLGMQSLSSKYPYGYSQPNQTNLVTIDLNTGEPYPFFINPDNYVYATMVHSGYLYIAGAFSSVGHVNCSGFVKVDLSRL